MKIDECLDEIFNHVSDICTMKQLSREMFAIAMCLSHYYTYYKSLKAIDRVELSVASVFLAAKIEYNFINIEEANTMYLSLKKSSSSNVPDFIKFEIEILNFLGFEFRIESPYYYFHSFMNRYYPQILKDEKFRSLGFSIINDSYRRPLCIYYEAKYLALSSMFIALNVMNYDVSFEEIASLEKRVNKAELINCSDYLFKIFETKINQQSTSTKNPSK
jgi:hypothetical protein